MRNERRAGNGLLISIGIAFLALVLLGIVTWRLAPQLPRKATTLGTGRWSGDTTFWGAAGSSEEPGPGNLLAGRGPQGPPRQPYSVDLPWHGLPGGELPPDFHKLPKDFFQAQSTNEFRRAAGVMEDLSRALAEARAPGATDSSGVAGPPPSKRTGL